MVSYAIIKEKGLHMPTTQVFGNLIHTENQEKSLELIFTDVTASVLSRSDVDLNGKGMLNVDSLLSLRVYAPAETAERLGTVDMLGAPDEVTLRVRELSRHGVLPVQREQHFLKIEARDQVLYAQTMLKPFHGEAPGFVKKMLGRTKLEYTMTECRESDDVVAMLNTVETNKMENLAWLEYFPMKGIIGTINDQWYIAPSSYGTLGLEGTVVKMEENLDQQFWPDDTNKPS